jgi:hypothetical protein
MGNSGTLGDGAARLKTLKHCGGITVVQDPSDAAFPEMPATALSLSQPDKATGAAEQSRAAAGRRSGSGSSGNQIRSGGRKKRTRNHEKHGSYRPAVRFDMSGLSRRHVGNRRR